MKEKLFAVALATSAVGCMVGAAPESAAGPAQPMSAKAAAELEEELRGRVAGNPVSCVHNRDLRTNQAIGDQAILFQGRNLNIVYLNQPAGRCAGLTHGRALITRTYSTKLCAGDIAEIVEPVSGAGVGTCVLGDFTPYRR